MINITGENASKTLVESRKKMDELYRIWLHESSDESSEDELSERDRRRSCYPRLFVSDSETSESEVESEEHHVSKYVREGPSRIKSDDIDEREGTDGDFGRLSNNTFASNSPYENIVMTTVEHGNINETVHLSNENILGSNENMKTCEGIEIRKENYHDGRYKPPDSYLTLTCGKGIINKAVELNDKNVLRPDEKVERYEATGIKLDNSEHHVPATRQETRETSAHPEAKSTALALPNGQIKPIVLPKSHNLEPSCDSVSVALTCDPNNIKNGPSDVNAKSKVITVSGQEKCDIAVTNEIVLTHSVTQEMVNNDEISSYASSNVVNNPTRGISASRQQKSTKATEAIAVSSQPISGAHSEVIHEEVTFANSPNFVNEGSEATRVSNKLNYSNLPAADISCQKYDTHVPQDNNLTLSQQSISQQADRLPEAMIGAVSMINNYHNERTISARQICRSDILKRVDELCAQCADGSCDRNESKFASNTGYEATVVGSYESKFELNKGIRSENTGYGWKEGKFESNGGKFPGGRKMEEFDGNSVCGLQSARQEGWRKEASDKVRISLPS